MNWHNGVRKGEWQLYTIEVDLKQHSKLVRALR